MEPNDNSKTRGIKLRFGIPFGKQGLPQIQGGPL
ncbi:unnamed protein product, partial [Didymodactylos carnosus]